ncbi:SETMAR [Cordylochernes scorpioides]|uniref:SETMAR n=1 Tax=Cordylochernes scorpioides TaxID=51811 RepID=A0ABY6L1L2_9ARAC|nr:SETMAR [Cordylochernes scorpioides]
MELPLVNVSTCELRSVIRFFTAKNETAVNIHRNLVSVYGEGCMSIQMVRRWRSWFLEGRQNVHDDERSDRPVTATDNAAVAAVRNVVEANRRVTIDEIMIRLPPGIEIGCSSIGTIMSDLICNRELTTTISRIKTGHFKEMNINPDMTRSYRNCNNCYNTQLTPDHIYLTILAALLYGRHQFRRGHQYGTSVGRYCDQDARTDLICSMDKTPQLAGCIDRSALLHGQDTTTISVGWYWCMDLSDLFHGQDITTTSVGRYCDQDAWTDLICSMDKTPPPSQLAGCMDRSALLHGQDTTTTSVGRYCDQGAWTDLLCSMDKTPPPPQLAGCMDRSALLHGQDITTTSVGRYCDQDARTDLLCSMDKTPPPSQLAGIVIRMHRPICSAPWTRHHHHLSWLGAWPDLICSTDKTSPPPQLAGIVIRVYGPICSMDKAPSPPQLAGCMARSDLFHGQDITTTSVGWYCDQGARIDLICSMDKTSPPPQLAGCTDRSHLLHGQDITTTSVGWYCDQGARIDLICSMDKTSPPPQLAGIVIRVHGSISSAPWTRHHHHLSWLVFLGAAMINSLRLQNGRSLKPSVRSCSLGAAMINSLRLQNGRSLKQSARSYSLGAAMINSLRLQNGRSLKPSARSCSLGAAMINSLRLQNGRSLKPSARSYSLGAAMINSLRLQNGRSLKPSARSYSLGAAMINSLRLQNGRSLKPSARYCSLVGVLSEKEVYHQLDQDYLASTESHISAVVHLQRADPTADPPCYRWFKKFQSGDFELDNEPHGKPPQKFEDAELQALLDEDSTQMQGKLAKQLQVSQGAVSLRLNSLGTTQKLSRWVPHEHEKKSFLHRIVTSDEKWIHFSNPTRQKSWGLPGQFPKQTPRPNRFGKKAMLCIWWDQTGVVYFELLKPGETVNTSRYEQQMHSLREALNEKRPEWREKHNNLILQHDNAPAHNATVVKNTIKDLGWEL